METIREHIEKLMNQRELTSAYQQMIAQALQDEEVHRFLIANEEELAPDAIERGAAKIYEFVSERNKRKKGEQPFAPDYQPTLIVSNHLIDVAYEPTRGKVQADEGRAKAALVTTMNMPKAIANARLEDYDATDRVVALNEATNFVVAQTTDPTTFHQGLYLTGPFGVGKTYLIGAIANYLADQNQASTLLHFPTFAVEMKAAISDQKVVPTINRIKRAPILMLDDIGAESFSPWIRDEVLGIILQYRMQEELPTLFTSNKTMAELTEFLAGNDRGDDELPKAQRIMQRIQYLSREVTVGGINRRLS
ncbi:primosomal protein DnaI [Lacticaseibacillus saniviri]|uniref:DNA replication protein n=1 Tax=Lacticaseibacillus saniviri JCM 17471 = DSM 24301 TaxID=1293598 RepID=A0A0R2MYE5_9LACO|nr:primosomal protein DnaI [Lacticaseibacillus saniviri]KRO16659.1 DNA replication protein [Lacticaseibacillus saniviri JCM 17471 = DSM 24301]MCG4282101.1 primosomal protein DnaI [Lacticaseibacillus saniviri]